MKYRASSCLSHTRSVNGVEYPAEDFAYVPDPDKPSTWKLPIIDLRHIGAAEAALNSDYRGHAVEIPEAARQLVQRRIARRRAELEAEQYGYD